MAKRPTTAQIRARQRNIIEGLNSRNLSDRQAAKQLGIEPRQLTKFLDTKPAQIRQQYNRSPAYRKLYGAGERHEIRRELGLRHLAPRVQYISQYEYRTIPGLRQTPEATQVIQTSERIRNLYLPQGYQSARVIWAQYTRTHHLPVSARSIRNMYRSGEITPAEFNDIMTTWQDIYNTQNQSWANLSWTNAA